MSSKKILIGITTAETVSHETMQSIYNLIVPTGYETILRIIHAYNVADGRNNLVNIMRNEHCDYIFFVDNDVVLPKNALVDLLSINEQFCVGTYPRKEINTIVNANPWTTLYNHNERNRTIYCPTFMAFSNLPKDGVVKVDCCGFGCALLKKEIFDEISQPWFFFAHEESKEQWGEYCIGEDMWFCRKVIKSGKDIFAHGNVLCGHVGKFIYGFPARPVPKPEAKPEQNGG